MKIEGVVDHLFRHQYGKMVSILTRIFGLSNLEMIEDAVQDTFIKAMVQWRTKIPENPEAWLTLAAKNRAIDLLRKIKSEDNRLGHLENGPSTIALNEMFLEHEIEDSQLRMIFTACHPSLNAKNQIAFALKTIVGFSDKEIAAALLLKEETVKKRLTRARKTIKEESISFAIPNREDMGKRIGLVHEVLYLIFNEGFHSTKSEVLIRKELCGEAIRLCSLVLKKEHLRTGEGYALFALFCFHAARLDTKLLDTGVVVDLKNQDRSKWHFPLIKLGNDAMNSAFDYEGISSYHLEAAVAVEHLKARSFGDTDWAKILSLRKTLYENHPTDYAGMNLVVVLLQLERADEAFKILGSIQPGNLEKRAYLFYGLQAEYYIQKGEEEEAVKCLEIALGKTTNKAERNYLRKKIMGLKG